jgi:hypothetical protein
MQWIQSRSPPACVSTSSTRAGPTPRDGSVRSAFEERPDLFSTVAFWYQDGIARDQPEPPYGSARLPMGNAQQIEVENLWQTSRPGREADGSARRVLVQGPAGVRGSWRRFAHRRAAGCPEDGTYEVIAQMGLSPDYGTYNILLDGKPTGESAALEHEPGANTAAPPLASTATTSKPTLARTACSAGRRWTKGRHTVSFVCTGKKRAVVELPARVGHARPRPRRDGGAPGLNTASPTDRADEVRRIGGRGATADLKALTGALGASADGVREAGAWSLTQMGPAAGPAVPALIKAMEDSSPVVRGLAAVALRYVEPGASAPALQTLTAHLSDPDENVRMMTAQAIARQGPGRRARSLRSLLSRRSRISTRTCSGASPTRSA